MPLPTPATSPAQRRESCEAHWSWCKTLITRSEYADALPIKCTKSSASVPSARGHFRLPACPSVPTPRQAGPAGARALPGCTVSPHSHQAHTCFLTQTSTDLGLQPNPRAWPLFLLKGRLASLSAVTSLSSQGEATSPKNAGLFNHWARLKLFLIKKKRKLRKPF